MTTDIVPVESEGISAAAILERALMTGDLSRLSPIERVAYYARTCESLGLNPLTRPFDYISLNGKLVLYAKKDATDQIRRNLHVNVTSLEYPTMPEGLYGVTANVALGSRTDSATGIVNIKGLAGDALANALMKAETKAKRRATLSIAGLGIIDESEVETIPDGERIEVDDSGVIKPAPKSVSEVVAAKVAALSSSEPNGHAADDAQVIPQPEERTRQPEPIEVVVSGPTDDIVAPREPSAPTAEMKLSGTPEGLSLEEFSTLVAQFSGPDRKAIRDLAKEMFPEATGFRSLSKRDLMDLYARFTSPTVQTIEGREVTVELDPADIAEEVLAAPMSEAESSTLVATCNEPSPWSDAKCVLPVEHKGAHRADEKESW